MSSTSSSPSPNGSAPNTPLTSPPLPASDEYTNPPRLDPILEHVQADHSQRTRAPSVSSVSFKGRAKGSPQLPPAQLKAKLASRIRDSSPPPPRQALLFLSLSILSHDSRILESRTSIAWVTGCYIYRRSKHPTPARMYCTVHQPSCSLTSPEIHCCQLNPTLFPTVFPVSVIQCTNFPILVSLNISEACGCLALTVDRTKQQVSASCLLR